MPNEPDELERVMRDSKVVDWFIAELPRSPRASGAQSSAPSLPVSGAGLADSRNYYRMRLGRILHRAMRRRGIAISSDVRLHAGHWWVRQGLQWVRSTDALNFEVLA